MTDVVDVLVVKQKVVVNAVNAAGKTPVELTSSADCRKILQKGKRGDVLTVSSLSHTSSNNTTATTATTATATTILLAEARIWVL
jgi:hypothetical protein